MMEENSIWEFFLKIWPKMTLEARIFCLCEVLNLGKKDGKLLTDDTMPRQGIFEEIICGNATWLNLLDHRNFKSPILT